MFFIKKYVPNKIIDLLIQYNYGSLPEKAKTVAEIKYNERRKPDPVSKNLHMKIDFNYHKLDLKGILFDFANTLNLYFSKEECQICKNKSTENTTNHWRKHLREIGYIDNPEEVIYKVLCNIDIPNLEKENMIHTLYGKLKLLAFKM